MEWWGDGGVEGEGEEWRRMEDDEELEGKEGRRKEWRRLEGS